MRLSAFVIRSVVAVLILIPGHHHHHGPRLVHSFQILSSKTGSVGRLKQQKQHNILFTCRPSRHCSSSANDGVDSSSSSSSPSDEEEDNSSPSRVAVSRRDWLTTTTTTATTAAALFVSATTTTTTAGAPALAADGEASPVISSSSSTNSDLSSSSSEQGLTVYKTPSGLKYIDLELGTGPTPSYGQLLSISYTGYVKLAASKDNPNPKPEVFETVTKPYYYLIKHGNGRTIAGLDEGLHTMQVGGKRRLLIPPKLGYTETGLGPVPTYPWDRAKLNALLQNMVAVKGGTLIYEVQLWSAVDDEADQGYYQDESLSPEEFEQLRRNLQQQAQAAADEGML